MVYLVPQTALIYSFCIFYIFKIKRYFSRYTCITDCISFVKNFVYQEINNMSSDLTIIHIEIIKRIFLRICIMRGDNVDLNLVIKTSLKLTLTCSWRNKCIKNLLSVIENLSRLSSNTIIQFKTPSYYSLKKKISRRNRIHAQEKCNGALSPACHPYSVVYTPMT